MAWLLAGVFAWAAAAKLRSPTDTAIGFAEVGVPRPRAAAWLVPIVELMTAAALVLRPSIGASAAFALLAGFTVFLGGVVRRGAPVSCRCFGTGSDRPVSERTLGRNGLLMAMALVIVAFG